MIRSLLTLCGLTADSPAVRLLLQGSFMPSTSYSSIRKTLGSPAPRVTLFLEDRRVTDEVEMV